MAISNRPLAVVTGASAGIGYELAKQCIAGGFDVIVAADDAKIEDAAATLRDSDAQIQAVQADLSGEEGVNKLYAAIGERKVAALLANAGRGLGRGFLDQDPAAWRKVVDTNITGTLLLVQKVAKNMRGAGEAHFDHRIDRRVHAGDVSGGLQRVEGVPGQLLLRAPSRVEGQWCDGDVPDAGRH
jgi:short-subunit dehydrogenase